MICVRDTYIKTFHRDPINSDRRHFGFTCSNSRVMALELVGKTGLRYLGVVFGLGIGGTLVFKAGPHFFPSPVCRYFFDTGIEVPEKCRSEFARRARKMNLDNADKVNLFVSKGTCGFSGGATSLPRGAVIGIPRWYIFDRGEDVVNAGINFKGMGIKWDTEIGSRMKETFIPSQENIAFTIGHEIAHIQHPEYKVAYVFLPMSWLYATYKGMNFVNRRIKMTLLIEIIFKLCVLRASYLVYKKVKTHIHYKEELLADEISAKVDIEAARGGIDAFKKRMVLNKILRDLHGKDGPAYYDEDGNDAEDNVHPKLSERMERLQEILNEHLDQSN